MVELTGSSTDGECLVSYTWYGEEYQIISSHGIFLPQRFHLRILNAWHPISGIYGIYSISPSPTSCDVHISTSRPSYPCGYICPILASSYLPGGILPTESAHVR